MAMKEEEEEKEEDDVDEQRQRLRRRGMVKHDRDTKEVPNCFWRLLNIKNIFSFFYSKGGDYPITFHPFRKKQRRKKREKPAVTERKKKDSAKE